ncbi:MAG: DUF2231 domain-containing protein [Phycisphaerales bacterium]
MKAWSRRFQIAVLLMTLAILGPPLRAQSEGQAPASELGAIVNTMCPVMPDEPVDPLYTTEYEGMTIGLCCRKCLRKFEADPTPYLANLYLIMLDSPQGADTFADEGDQPVATPEASDTPPVRKREPHLVTWLGQFHPLATHLPIGMLVGAMFAELMLVLTRRDHFRHATAFCVGLGALTAVVAATLGWFNGGFVLLDHHWIRATHRWLGTGTATLSLVTLAILVHASRPASEPRSRVVFRVSLLLTIALLTAAGFFGGALVYGLDHYAWN